MLDEGVRPIVCAQTVRTRLLTAREAEVQRVLFGRVVVESEVGISSFVDEVEISFAERGFVGGSNFVHLDSWGRRTTGDLPLRDKHARMRQDKLWSKQIRLEARSTCTV